MAGHTCQPTIANGMDGDECIVDQSPDENGGVMGHLAPGELKGSREEG